MAMHKIEVSAATVAEAVEEALSQLGRDEDEALIEVLSQTADSALVRVSVLEDDDDEDEEPASLSRRRRSVDVVEVINVARTMLENLLHHMEINAFVTPVMQTSEDREGDEEQSVTLHIEGVDEETTGLVIGRRGETLRSLQYLLNLLIHRQTGHWPQVVIDIGHYRQRRQDSLEGLAHRMADRVRQTGRALPLEPMSAYERRVIHMALHNDQSVYTESSGEGDHRKIIIYPAKH